MPAHPLSAEKQSEVRRVFAETRGNGALTASRCGVSGGTVLRYCRDLREAMSGHLPVAALPPAAPGVGPDPDTVMALIRRVLDEREGKPTAPVGAVEVIQAPPVKIEPPGRTRLTKANREYERVAWVSDLHHPFHDPTAIDLTVKALRDYRPELLVMGGDGFDCYSISAHDKDPDRAPCLQDEFDGARETWKLLDDLGSDVVWLDGNHEVRIRRLQQKNPGLFSLRSMELPIAAELPKRWMHYPNQTQFQVGPLTLLHGDLAGRGTSSVHAAAGMLSKLRTSCLFGHLHRFQTFMQTGYDRTVRAGYANGHLCDVEKALYISAPCWQSGFSTVDFDWSLGIFSVTPHLIVKNATRWGSTTYTS